MKITRTNPLTGKINTLELNTNPAEITAWRGGAYIQDAMTELNADEREFIMTGILPGEFDILFAEAA